MIQGHRSERESDTEEIDLLELYLLLWEQKVLILVIAAVFGLVALLYAYQSSRVYETSASVLPPRLSDISAYNLGRTEAGLAELKVADVYAVFTRNLTSQALRQRFFDEVYRPSLATEALQTSRDILWNNFNQVLVVSNPQPKLRPDYFEVIGKLDDPKRAAEWVNRYVAMASETATQTMQQNVLSEINTRVQAIQKRIDVMRASALTQREGRMVRLREALVIAEAAGIAQPVPATVTVVMETARSYERQLYLRGTKAIKAELEVLSQRKSDDPFIFELYELQSQLAFLKSIDVKPSNVAVFTLDRAAEAPELPANLRKGVVLVIGLGIGCLLGVFVALIRGLFLRRLEGASIRYDQSLPGAHKNKDAA